jgi:hypothetical protein
MKNKIYIAFGILSTFMLLPVVMELVLFGYQFQNDYDMEVFIFFQLFSLTMAFVFLRIFKGFVVSKKGLVFYCKKIQRYTFFVAILFLGIFFIFFLKKIGDYDKLYMFMELYRNGHFKGSGGYTFGITGVSMLMMTYIVAFSKNLSYWFYFSLIVALMVVFLLGLRVFLLGLFLFSVIRIVEKYSIFKIITILTLILGFMLSFKMYLAMNIHGEDFLEVIQGVMGRMHFRVLLNYSEFSMPIGEFSCLIPGSQYLTDCDLPKFKEWFVSTNPDVAIYMSFISLYSGVAISWPVLMYNLFGFFGFVFVVPFIMGFILLIKKSFATNSIYLRVLYIFLSIRLFGALVEDIGFVTYVFHAFVAVIAVFILIKIGLIMKLIFSIREGNHLNYY